MATLAIGYNSVQRLSARDYRRPLVPLALVVRDAVLLLSIAITADKPSIALGTLCDLRARLRMLHPTLLRHTRPTSHTCHALSLPAAASRISATSAVISSWTARAVSASATNFERRRRKTISTRSPRAAFSCSTASWASYSASGFRAADFAGARRSGGSGCRGGLTGSPDRLAAGPTGGSSGRELWPS